MMSSEPDATACMPGETPIDTICISMPLAAKKPFLVATVAGHRVAVGETWPNVTLSAAWADSAAVQASAADATITAAPVTHRDPVGFTRPPACCAWRVTRSEEHT